MKIKTTTNGFTFDFKNDDCLFLNVYLAEILYLTLKAFKERQDFYIPIGFNSRDEFTLEVLNPILETFDTIANENHHNLGRKDFEKLQKGLDLFAKYFWEFVE